MNIVLALHHAGAFRSFEEVVRYWCASGHRVHVLVGDLPKPIAVDRGLTACQAELNGFHVERMQYREKWLKLVNVRELLNYANYLRPEHPNIEQARRWKGMIVRPIRKVIKRKWMANLLSTVKFRQGLRKVESLIPPDPTIVDWLRENRPDVVVASPFIFPLSNEVEYIKAARALAIPTVVIVLSWDNLTSKGTFHIIPDLTLVWNAVLAEEAATLHDVPKDRIAITGAPAFDFWYVMGPSVDFSGFAGQVGINPPRPFVLYLCSSRFIAENEHLFVAAFALAMKENAKTRDVHIVVRPHPLNDSIWRDFKAEGVVIWPKAGEWVDVPRAKQDYYDTIFHSKAVVGVNTSAFLEAAILDKPCTTVVTEHSKAKQSGLGHFQHLLNGDFLEVAASYSEAASIIGEILAGSDLKQAQRQRFVQDFIRPCGMDIPASHVMAKAIETVGMGKRIPKRTATLKTH